MTKVHKYETYLVTIDSWTQRPAKHNKR